MKSIKPVILINNKFVTKSDATISVLSDAFGRGYGVFETLRTFDNKKLFRASEHIDRLFHSAKLIDLKIKYKKPEILKMIEKTIKKSLNQHQRIKIIAIKEGIIMISTKVELDPKIYKGISCKSVMLKRELPEVKSISYLSSYLAHEKAVKGGAYDAILIDEKSEVYEGAYSNIFWFEKDILYTRKGEVLPGITRKAIIEFSPFKVKYKNIKLKDLYKTSEIFLTQSVSGIVPVKKIDGRKIGKGEIGKNTGKIIEIYKKATQK